MKGRKYRGGRRFNGESLSYENCKARRICVRKVEEMEGAELEITAGGSGCMQDVEGEVVRERKCNKNNTEEKREG